MPFFFFNDTATTEIYTLSLHDALPISVQTRNARPPPSCFVKKEKNTNVPANTGRRICHLRGGAVRDRKSTRLNSSHANISYAVFCLKKKTTPTVKFH